MAASDRTAVSTFDRVASDLTHLAFPEMAAAIRARTKYILKSWRRLSLKAMPHLDQLTLREFENNVSEILLAAADAFESADPRRLLGVMESGPQHGIDRFLQDYSLLDLFEEVRILRGAVIVEVAGELKRTLGVEEAATFHAVFDIIIQQGVMMLVQKQAESFQQAEGIMRDMNQKLMVASVHQGELAEQAQKSQAALRESEEMRRFSQQAAGIGTWTWDGESGVVQWSRETYDLFGIDPHTALVYESWRNALHPDDRERTDTEAQRAMERGANLDVEYRINHPTRGERWLTSIGRVIDPLHRRGYMTGVSMDITERKEAEVALRDSEERFRTIFELGPVAIYSIDSSGVIQNFNRQAANLWGRAPQIGDTDQRFCGSFKMFRPDGTFMPHDQCPMAEVVSGRVAEVCDGEVVIERPDGSRVIVIVNIRPLKTSRGEVVGAVNCFYDITHRVALERQIKEQAEQLAGESRRKDEFLAMLSHELRNPLAPIRSAVHLLRTQECIGEENPIQKQAYEIIERQVASLTKMVSDLLEVSRVTSGRIRLNLQVVDMNQVIAHAVETAMPVIEQHRHEFTMNLCPEGVWCNADPTRLEEVFINLLNNAAKYTSDGGRIEVWCEHPHGTNYAQFRIRDNGMGIDEKLLPRIFDLFTQADRSLARSAGGLGIGLSLARRLVDLHGGSIEAHSEGPGNGAEFIVKLTLVPAPEAPQHKLPSQPSGMLRPPGMRVLIVDDNIDLVMVLATALRQKGYSVQSAYTGPEGLKVADLWRPDIVLLDIGLPGLDGYEVARRLRAPPAVEAAGGQTRGGGQNFRGRLIALTGYGRNNDLAMAREAGFDAHLTKPCDFADLEKLLHAPAK